jgi:hypothetical protein
MRTGWYGFLLAVSFHAYAPQGNLPRDAGRVRLGPSIPEVAIVHPRRRSNFLSWRQTYFRLRPFADSVLPGPATHLGPEGFRAG